MAQKSHISIYSALVANLLIAATKFTAGGLTRSSSMISEGIHTMVDTSNELLLLYGLHKSKRPPDQTHPWGYGKELYFWSFVVSILIFGFGGGVAIYQGILRIMHPVEIRDLKWNYLVLGLSAIFESTSLAISAYQFNKTRNGLSWWKALIRSKDPANFIILIEDVADVMGLFIVLLSVIGTQIWHEPHLDGIASVAVGVLLVCVSSIVARESRSLLMGEGVTTEHRTQIISHIEQDTAVDKVIELFSIYQSPEEIVLMITVKFREGLQTTDINDAITRVTHSIKQQFELVKFVVIQSGPVIG